MRLGVAEPFVDPGPPRQRCVLAALLVDAGRLVTWDTLIDRVWGDAPPTGARHSLYSHIARVRRVLEQAAVSDARLVRQSGGYRLEVDPDLVDVHRFRDLVGRAHRLDRTDPAKAALLREALALWRGEPLAGLDGPWVTRTRAAWRQQHLDATVAWARAELGTGRPDPVIGPLTDLVREHPLVEPAVALLMRALSATGRDAEALEHYAQTRRRLAEELGTEPGAELRGVHQAILRGDGNRSAPGPPAAGTPRQLPLSARGFVGRVKELARLDAVLAEAGAVPIVALSGLAGVGKTALAVHWAHRVADRFPDGQLYVNLRGFDPAGPAVSPAEAVRGFLDAFDVSPHRIPARPDAQIALYRSLVAGRRVLVLLDNARNADQVRPLLPGSPGCLVVVTSRDQLSGLSAAEGAHPVVLTPLSAAEARQLLTHRLGRGRVAAEPDAVDEIVSRCGRLPVALAVVAARAATHHGFPLAAIAEELRDAAAILDVLGSGDPTTDIRAVFTWSYRTLSPAAARLFRLLAWHPGPQIGVPAAASLAGSPVAQVRPLLAELARAHLLIEHLPGRFAFHDLLRAFAAERARTLDTGAERRAATRRMLDHYLLTAHAAETMLRPHRVAVVPAPAAAGVSPEGFATAPQALDWFAREHPALLGVFQLAVTAEPDTHAWQLARTLTTFHLYRGHWHDQISTQRTALATAQRRGNRLGQAHAHHDLGHVYACLGRYAESHAELTRAVDLYGAVGNPNGQASAHYLLGFLAGERDDTDDALHQARRCRDLYEAARDPVGQARALNALGLALAKNGEYREALGFCEQAVTLHRELGDQRGEAAAMDSLGFVHSGLGHRGEFIAWYRQALALLRDVGDRFGEAHTLTNLGEAHRSHGDIAAATGAWSRALSILDELDHPDAEQIRAKLRAAAATVAS
ncbi:MAG TPA: BTAD domain-containing putative transcriptional regulator [Actinophytocola sp.]|uniref:AfsR/SARP family transcriptional regulator n=1 Tax=Actinophytocola sp. TaxID=1872138 RepID=UPI002DDCAF9C|nr:BTAD domain-containing putative transcriptional regulator [Actinophytocola sp.]HEV2783723.1 BTAD domain-containing putative transcriptional regulator [Actinophytocola sp.]